MNYLKWLKNVIEILVLPKLGLGNMWANINPTYSYNKTHTHPNSMWSGVYYIKVPKNSGKLFLEDPRPGPNTHMPKRVDNLPESLWRVCAYDTYRGSYDIFSILATARC